MNQIKDSDFIGYADMIKIIFDDYCINGILDNEHCLNYLTFAAVFEQAKKNGYENGTIILIAESPLDGTVYQYGNYGDFWVEHGKTNGYA